MVDLATCRSTGANLPRLSPKTLAEFTVPLPPIEEQRRIAEILDKADAIRRKRKEAIRLTESLLRSAFLDMFGDPVTNPKEWQVENLSKVVDPETVVTYGIVQAGPEFDGGVPYIRTGDIKNGQICIPGLRRTDPSIADRFKRSEVRTGDLVMSIRATVGTIAEVPPSLDGANLTQGTARIAPGPLVEKSYLKEFIRSNGCQHWIQGQVKGATFREITLKRLREMPVMLPPLSQQIEFDRIAKKIDLQKQHSQFHFNEAEQLFSSLLQRAFSGEL